MLKYNYFMNRETGEILTYSQVNKIFYSVPRRWDESIFDEWQETDIESDEAIAFPDFSKVF